MFAREQRQGAGRWRLSEGRLELSIQHLVCSQWPVGYLAAAWSRGCGCACAGRGWASDIVSWTSASE